MVSQTEYKSILVPWNFSNASKLALDKALEMAGPSTRVDVVHIANPYAGPDNGALFLASEGSHRCVLRQRFREQIGEQCRDPRLRFDVEFGFVKRELVRCADRLKSGIIVISSRPKTRISNLLAGDIANYLRQHASCPVHTLEPVSKAKTARSHYSRSRDAVAAG